MSDGPMKEKARKLDVAAFARLAEERREKKRNLMWSDVADEMCEVLDCEQPAWCKPSQGHPLYKMRDAVQSACGEFPDRPASALKKVVLAMDAFDRGMDSLSGPSQGEDALSQGEEVDCPRLQDNTPPAGASSASSSALFNSPPPIESLGPGEREREVEEID